MTAPQEPPIVIAELESLLERDALTTLSRQSITELRDLRDRLAEIETGLSFGRRMAQGRLDIIVAELEARGAGAATADAAELLARLPEVLARRTRGGGTPRPVQEIGIPDFADDLVAGLDAVIGVVELGVLGTVDVLRLTDVAEQLAAYERAISTRRHEVHRLMDEVQEEIIGRYRSGAASVDDLLR